jgi:choline kinase
VRGIILAAGRGRRLEPVLPDKPKCLLPFGNKSLIQHQIAALVQNGITDIVVVVGYEQQQVRDHLKDQLCSIAYIENPIFDSTNTIYSLWLCREFFNDDFIYFNADVLFDYRIVKRLCEGSGGSWLACVPGQCGQEEVKVIVREGLQITEIGKHMPSEQCYGEFIGIAKFAKEDNMRFAEILDACVQDQSTWKYFFEYAVDKLCRENVLSAVDISDLPATEIDFPEDLQRAKEQVLPLLAQLEESGY